MASALLAGPACSADGDRDPAESNGAAVKQGEVAAAPVAELPDDQLIALLSSQDSTARYDAVYQLGSRKARAAVPGLMRSLRQDPDPRVRASSAWALGQIGSGEVIAPLQAALTDESTSVQLETLDALGELGSTESVPLIVPFLKSEDTAYDARYALKLLSGEDHGDDPTKWLAWWADSMSAAAEARDAPVSEPSPGGSSPPDR